MVMKMKVYNISWLCQDFLFRSVGYSAQWGIPLSGVFRSVGYSAQWGIPLSGVFRSVVDYVSIYLSSFYVLKLREISLA
jgi:hypothetical protein